MWVDEWRGGGGEYLLHYIALHSLVFMVGILVMVHN